MFDFLKNFFNGKEADANENGNVFQHQAGVRQTAPQNGSSSSSAAPFRPKYPRQNTPTAPEPSAVSPASAAPGGGLDIPLHAVLSGLPMELKRFVRTTEVGDATLTISMDRVFSQIASGAVKLPFGELRRAAPELFLPQADCDQAQVALPLNEILSRLDSSKLARRQNQKHIAVPEEISSPFGSDGNGLIFSAGPVAPEAPAAPRSITPAAATSSPGPIEKKPAPPLAAPSKSGNGTAFRSANPAAMKPQPMQQTPSAPAPAQPAPVQPAPIPLRNSITSTPPPAAPASPAIDTHSAIPVSSALRNLSSSIGIPASANTPAAPSAQPVKEGPTLTVRLAVLSEPWPEALRQEMLRLNLLDANVALPVESIEEAMKRGKITFPWKTIQSWIRPTILSAGSAHDSTVLELPLKVIAPLFMAWKKQPVAPNQQKVAIDENIPNLFFGFPQPDDGVSAPVASSPAPAPIAPAAPPLSYPVAKPLDTNYYVWSDDSDSAHVDETEFKRKPTIETNFLSRYATPNEVVARAAAMEGVYGALVALPDGLMVASKLPADLNGDTLAAFLPQIFGKVSQCTRELRMGELNNLNFTVGNVPWKIFRVNAIFFAVFGRAGQGLPTAQLASLAAELDRKKQ